MIGLMQIDNAVFDLKYDDGTVESIVSTLVYAALFTDAEAPESIITDRYERSGWWAAPSDGTGLWHVRRQALSNTARLDTVSMVKQALIDHGFASVVVNDVTPAGNVSSIILTITGLHNGRTFSLGVEL